MEGKILWILDNGHGIDTPGKRSPRLTDGRQLLEYRFNREVVGLILALLEMKSLKSIQLVPEEKDIPLSTRVWHPGPAYRRPMAMDLASAGMTTLILRACTSTFSLHGMTQT